MHDDAALELLRTCTIEPVGVLTQASNLTLLVDLAVDGEPTGHRAVYKPARGERPLHDFPPGSLAAREVAAYAVSRAGGFDIVPPTVLREGPLGAGSVQWWVEQEADRLADPAGGLVEVLPPEQLGPGWRAVVQGEDEQGAPVVVAHADDPRLRTMAVLDVVLNNADRKAAHLTLDLGSRLRGFDHGVCLHEEDKLRTVLWGFAGEQLADEDARRLTALERELDDAGGDCAEQLGALLTPAEATALRTRARDLREVAVFPMPPTERYPLPWPLW
ncbi:SCO1664 family protein [Serinicoccus kebangsaanensis]|uniref:SCO1664 family protein n=1 Tax=Serinicoccus kebangsaanensis TaxID=2602069 RepID=UPI00192D7D4F|nr:SCO1664 family protein [Serinicoccus kebangsaanensis]